MNIDYKNMPIIYDIKPKYVWIPLAAATSCLLFTKLGYPFLTKLLAKCFPLEENQQPLANYRTRIRREMNNFSNLFPVFAHLIQVDIPDNLHISVFIISIIQLKQSTSFSNLPAHVNAFILATSIPFLCNVLTLGRTLTVVSLHLISDKCSRFSFVSSLLRKLAISIDTRNVTLQAGFNLPDRNEVPVPKCL